MQTTSRQENNIAHWVSEYPKYVHFIRHPGNAWFFGAVVPPKNSKEDDVWNHLVKKLQKPGSETPIGYL